MYPSPHPDKLRHHHHISLRILSRRTENGVHTVKAAACMPGGRWDEAIAAVPVAGLTGEALARALVAAETRAKRRVTLSICPPAPAAGAAGATVPVTVHAGAPAVPVHPSRHSPARTAPRPRALAPRPHTSAPVHSVLPHSPPPVSPGPKSSIKTSPINNVMKVHSHARPGSDAWLAMRRGLPTASRLAGVITAARGDLSRSAETCIHELIAETVPATHPAEDAWSPRRSPALVAEALAAFKLHTSLRPAPAGFVLRGDDLAGCTPDALVYDPRTLRCLAGLALQCPSPARHVALIAGGALPDGYKQKIHACLAITGLPEWHFWSWCPGLQPVHIVVPRDEYTARVAESIDTFIEQYHAAREALLPKLLPVPPSTETAPAAAPEPEPEPAPADAAVP
jgi:hypothetical protein